MRTGLRKGPKGTVFKNGEDRAWRTYQGSKKSEKILHKWKARENKLLQWKWQLHFASSTALPSCQSSNTPKFMQSKHQERDHQNSRHGNISRKDKWKPPRFWGHTLDFTKNIATYSRCTRLHKETVFLAWINCRYINVQDRFWREKYPDIRANYPDITQWTDFLCSRRSKWFDIVAPLRVSWKHEALQGVGCCSPGV